jgi:hypothetical protein
MSLLFYFRKWRTLNLNLTIMEYKFVNLYFPVEGNVRSLYPILAYTALLYHVSLIHNSSSGLFFHPLLNSRVI